MFAQESMSVVIPTYNSGQTIAAALKSVVMQTLPPAEAIVVDDASRDDTVAVAEAFARKSAVPIRVIRLDRNSGGPARPFNVGIEASRSELIATLEHDDRMHSEKLQRQMECLSRDPTLGMAFCRIAAESSGTRRHIIEAANAAIARIERVPLAPNCFRISAKSGYQALVSSGCFVLTCSTFLFKKDVWRDGGGFDEQLRCSCDYGFLQAALKRHHLGFVDEELLDWAAPPDSLYQATPRLNQLRENLWVLDSFDDELLDDAHRKVLRSRRREELLEMAFFARQARGYLPALNFYWTSIRRGGLSKEALFGIAKLLPHRLLRSRAKAHS